MIDFEEAVSPVMCFLSVRTLLALRKNMIVHQMDIVTAFLSVKLNKEINMGKGILCAD